MRTSCLLRAAAAATAALLVGAPAHAMLVTFDDLPWVPIESWSDNPVTDQYASLGVSFQGAYLVQTYMPGPVPPHPNQLLLGDIGFSVSFSGSLPKYVSFNMSSPQPDTESYVQAWHDGLVATGRTGGVYPDGSQDPPIGQDFPYQPNRYITLYSPTGIESMTFANAYGTRTSALIDNLYFGAVPAVPEPAALALWAAGLGVMAAVRRRQRGSRV
ncbi:MAG: PEP-CTERM sorting domain-containing protein [Rhizobacter sp.]|nr:PEP-CTERM sorting domain-containing protein [Rhizobacter sp.]